MDQIDKTLLALLRQDSSQPLKALGARVGLSASSVRERIARMQAAGAIRRFTVEPGEAEGAVAAMLSLKLRTTPDLDAVAAIVARADVARCYSMSGAVDLLVELCGDSVPAVNAARDEIARLAGVESVQTALVLKREKPGRQSCASAGP